MNVIVFEAEKFPYKIHALIASLNIDGNLVFNDELRYPAMNGEAGREVDDCLIVRTEHKKCILNLLSQAFDGVSNTCGEVADARLFCALERVARSGHWKSLDEIEKWLMDRDVPFSKQKWVDIK